MNEFEKNKIAFDTMVAEYDEMVRTAISSCSTHDEIYDFMWTMVDSGFGEKVEEYAYDHGQTVKQIMTRILQEPDWDGFFFAWVMSHKK